MIVNKHKRNKYADELRRRLSEIQVVLEGRQAIDTDRHHCCRGIGGWSNATLENCVIIDQLDLNMAIDGVASILKELKKIAK